ncbi:MAG: hypothetical protein COB30_016375 [Ectothiorhodospiraceae bacterium]|nr:hypothetical protein [Ectothiorhodospiraceae bacterium]MBN4053010.1 hypothetical protein [Gammaproteobacteria bacterium AH-315-K14]
MAGVRYFYNLLLIAAALALVACSDPNRELLNQKVIDAETRITTLGSALQSGSIRNATILKEYAKILRKDRPDLEPITTGLAREGTEKGQQYLFLKTRLSELQKHVAQVGNPAQLLPEAEALVIAANPATFNNALADPINVLADLSEGKLARVGVLSQSNEASYNDTKSYGAGSQMIGNPAYGQWNSSRGTSFWEFYGMYSMFSMLTGGNRVYRNDWNRYRPYSYYQDVGVDRYGSSRERSKYRSSYSKSSGVSKNKKNFSGQRKSSSLGQGSGSRARSAATPRKSSSLSSKSSRSSSSSSRSGSLRSSSTYSRSFRGGK